MTVCNAIPCLKDLEQLEFGIRIKNQQHTCGHQAGTTGINHQLQRRNLSTDLQRQDVLAGGLVELHRPVFRAAAMIQGLSEVRLQLGICE